jgi:glutaredoxin 3
MYTTEWCGYCVRAKALLDSKGIAYEEIQMEDDPAFRKHLVELTGNWTVPQIIIGETPIGGYTELAAIARAGGLDQYVQPAA